jgi:hypothetical protein
MAQDDARTVMTDECFTSDSVESEAAASRAAIFNAFIDHFGLQQETNTGCATTRLDYNGAGDLPSFWFVDNTANRCSVVGYLT